MREGAGIALQLSFPEMWGGGGHPGFLSTHQAKLGSSGFKPCHSTVTKQMRLSGWGWRQLPAIHDLLKQVITHGGKKQVELITWLFSASSTPPAPPALSLVKQHSVKSVRDRMAEGQGQFNKLSPWPAGLPASRENIKYKKSQMEGENVLRWLLDYPTGELTSVK